MGTHEGARNLRRAGWAVVCALILRAGVLQLRAIGPNDALENGYWTAAATLASGHNLLMKTLIMPAPVGDPTARVGAVEFARQREAAGGRIDAQHPYPDNLEGWIPATLHPAGYSVLQYVLYEVFNFRIMTLVVHALQLMLDALVCWLVYIFARNIFDARVGVIAAWLYAFCAPAIFLCTSFLPDALHCFFTALFLATASCAFRGSAWWLLVTGACIGLACHFRSEYLLFPVPLIVASLLTRRPVRSTLLGCAGLLAAMLLVLSPWALWTKAAIGRTMLTSTGGGATMYQSLGEDASNPWGIVCQDSWTDQDALRRGFNTQYSLEAHDFYTARFKACVREHPGNFLKQVLTLRLPLALVPPYSIGNRRTADEFSFSYYRQAEGLSRWQVVAKYPGKVIQYMWPQLMMLSVSAILLLAMPIALYISRRQLGKFLWIVLPWGHTVATLVLVKQHEPRNMASILIVQVVALGLVLAAWRTRREHAPGGRGGPAV